MSREASNGGRIRVWPAPIFLGVIASVGLISALLSDGGFGDYLAWLTLAIPVAVVLWYLPPRRTRKQQTDTAPSAAENS